MRYALVTMAVGRQHQRLFARFALPTWKRYAARHGIDLVIFREPLDTSARAVARSPAWQKCLAVTHPSVVRYRQVAWVDADILINPGAPSLFAVTPRDRLGAVDAYEPEARAALPVLYADWKSRGVPFIDNRTAEAFHTLAGFPAFPRVVQSGVMVLDPGVHGETFRHVYDRCDNHRAVEWTGEMRALSAALQQRHAIAWLDPRFNRTWASVAALHHPRHIPRSSRTRAGAVLHRIVRRVAPDRRLARAVHAELQRSYLLHFAGCHGVIRSSVFDRQPIADR